MRTVTASPNPCAPSASVTVSGSGYASRQRLTLFIGSSSSSFRATTSGSFKRTVTAPSATAVIAVKSSGVTLASTTLTVNTPTPTPTPTPTGFVQKAGTALTLNGASWRMKGASVLFALDNAARDCDAAVAMGLNTIRIVNFLDEGSAGSPYDAWRWSRVDGLISAAKTRGLRVILDLSTYRNQLHNQGKNPYTTDWGPFLTFVAGKYKAETAIALYALAGEPEPNDASYLVAFYQKALSQLRMADPNHIITAGGLLQYSWGGVPWQQIFDVTDLGTVHVYSAGDEGYLPTIASYCAGKGKPWIIEEFGFEQSMGDSSRATSFSRVYGEAKSASGVAFWNLGPEVKPDTYDVNAQTPLTLAAVQAN